MRFEFIETLHCPYSGSRFIISVLSGSDRSVSYGIASSEAGDFPIIDGILRLKVDEYRVLLVDLIKKDKRERALRAALDAPFYGRVGRVINLLDRTAHKLQLPSVSSGLAALKTPMYRALTDDKGTLASTMSRLKSTSGVWHLQRFTMPHFLPTYPLLHLVEGAGRVLDLGCGMGHAAFLMSRRVKASHITCADVQFYALYLARRLFIPDANFVCLDAEYLLPFDSAYFSIVFSSDALHFIDSKLSLSQEFSRILSDDGLIILPHLHNKLSPISSGRSLTPEGYSALFAGMERRIVPEDWMVAQFVAANSVDLDSTWTLTELRDADKGLSLVASKDKSVFRRHAGVCQKYAECILNPTINPVYQAVRRNGNWELKKQRSTAGRNRHVPGDNAYLPDTKLMSVPSLNTDAILTLKVADFPTFSELTRRFVLIDVPPHFQ